MEELPMAALKTARTHVSTKPPATGERAALLIVTLMLVGRAMTLAYIGAAGGAAEGDRPNAWLMPLIGDAVIGLLALPVAYLIVRVCGAAAWAAIGAWNVVGVWDALSVWLVNEKTPWPDFFMLEIFGESMFFAASTMHIAALVLLFQPKVKHHFLANTNEA